MALGPSKQLRSGRWKVEELWPMPVLIVLNLVNFAWMIYLVVWVTIPDVFRPAGDRLRAHAAGSDPGGLLGSVRVPESRLCYGAGLRLGLQRRRSGRVVDRRVWRRGLTEHKFTSHPISVWSRLSHSCAAFDPCPASAAPLLCA